MVLNCNITIPYFRDLDHVFLFVKTNHTTKKDYNWERCDLKFIKRNYGINEIW